MAETTVKEFAGKVGRDVSRLLEQMSEAGLPHKAENDAVSEEDKQKLLDYLTKSHGGAGARGNKNRITMTRKTRSKIRTGDGRNKTIEVQVRKKRTYVKRGDEENGEQAQEQQAHAVEQASDAASAATQAPTQAAVSDTRTAEPAAATAETSGDQKAPVEPVAPTSVSPEDGAPAGDAPPREPRNDNNRRPARRGEGDTKSASGRRDQRRDDADERSERNERKRGGKKVKRAEQRRGGRRGGNDRSDNAHGFQKPLQNIVREVAIPESISVAELADKMAIKSNEVIKAMFKMGAAVTINQTIDQDTAAIVVEEMGHTPRLGRCTRNGSAREHLLRG